MRGLGLGGAVCCVALLLGSTRALAAQPACSFQRGFASVQDAIPDVIGECVDDEVYDMGTGDALQQTTSGLLVWRKLDNWTAFTDGNHAWVNGPLGLQQRHTDQRFWWEANPDGLTIIPTPEPGDRCHTAGLLLSLGRVDAGAGNLVGTFRFTSTLDVECTLFGYPGAQLLDEAADPVPTAVERGGGYFANTALPNLVDVAPHATAEFRIHWEQVPVGNETTCSMASDIAIIPPDEYVALIIATQVRACGGGHLDITPVQFDGPV